MHAQLGPSHLPSAGADRLLNVWLCFADLRSEDHGKEAAMFLTAAATSLQEVLGQDLATVPADFVRELIHILHRSELQERFRDRYFY
jgi:hypothetical protein